METPGHGLIVVDTNILAYLLIEGDYTAQAKRLLGRDTQWAAPSFWRVEFLNVLMNYSRHQNLPPADVRGIWKASFQLAQLREEAVEAGEALELALRYKLSGYDALFAALAHSLNTVCVTQDKAFRKALPALTVTMDEFLERQ
jgi:predicted nucleic acid-binding protein